MRKRRRSDTEEEDKLVLSPVDSRGGARSGMLGISYDGLCELIGFAENNGPQDKTEATWSVQDQFGRQATIWCYKEGKQWCTSWSCDGDDSLLREVFGHRYYPDRHSQR